MEKPILVTGAAGRVGAVGRMVTELLLKQGNAVRAMVRTEDERAQALRDMGAEVVIGNLLDLDSMHRAIAGCETMYFGMSVSADYLAATVNAAAVAKHHGVQAFINMSQMTLSEMSITETTASPQHKLQWLSEQALNWSGLPVVHVRPTVFLEGFFLTFTADSVREANQIRLPFGEGKTSPIAAKDVARVVAALLIDPQPHIGKIYQLTGPQSENMNFFAQEYSKALGRTITFQDIPVGPWREGLLQSGLPIHLVNHLATMADLHRAGRYDRMSNEVLTLTGQGPLSLQDFVRKNAATFTPAKAAGKTDFAKRKESHRSTIMESVSMATTKMKVGAAKLSGIKTLSLLSFVGGVAVALGFSSLAASRTSQHVYELRMYHVNEGKMDALIARFGDHTDAIFKRHNMKSIGFWRPQDSPYSQDLFVYILEHPSREEARENWAAFQADPEWKKVKADSEINGALANHIDSYFMDPTSFSALR